MLRAEAWGVALAPPIAILAVWTLLALAGASIWLPVPIVASLTALFVLAALLVGARRVRGMRRPGPVLVDRRLEIVSALPHRPLAALRDRPSVPGSLAVASGVLWAAHQTRTLDRLGGLRAGWPRPPIAAIDRFRLRFVLPLLLAVGIALTGSRAVPLVLSTLLPGVVASPAPAGRIEAWITPPAFSGQAPIFLHAGSGDPPSVPAGSRLSVALTGSEARPRLILDGGGHTKPRFHRLSQAGWQAGFVLRNSTTFRVRQGGHLVGAWTVTVDPVGAPRLAWTAAPGAWRGGWRTRLPWSARDPFGVTMLRAVLRPVRPPGAPPIVVPIPLGGTPKEARGVELPDLSASPFAGTEVEATLVATNGAGISGRSATTRFTLPERPFRDPLARAILAVRRRLALDPASRRQAVGDLETLGEVPGAFDNRLGLFLNLESVAGLLAADRRGAAVDEAEDRLWQLALEVEDEKRDGAAAAERDIAVRSARDAVDRQVARMRELGASGRAPAEQQELAKRLDALRRALDARMDAMMRNALRNGLVLPPNAARSSLGANGFDRMMRDIQREAASGHVDDAARALSRMEDLLDRMRPATADDVRRALAARAAEGAAQADLAAVGDMIRREAGLLDRTAKRETAAAPPPADDDAAAPPPPLFRLGPDGALQPSPTPPQPRSPPPRTVTNPAEEAAAAAERAADRAVQHALARADGIVASRSGGLPGGKSGALGKAASAMEAAEGALGTGDDRAAATAENEALRDLQTGGRDMQQAMRNSLSGGAGGGALVPGFASNGSGEGGDQPNGDDDGGGADERQQTDRDPLGRSLDGQGKGTADDTELALPDGDRPNASRAIEEELRRRDSDRQRPRQELDYLGRLLQAF